MRPRKFILPQTGTGGYGIRPYVFCGDGEGHVFPCCVCRGDHWSPVNLPPQRIFRDSFLVRQAGTGEQCSPLQMFFDSLSPKYSCPPHVSLPHRLRAEPPRRGGQEGAVPRVEFSPFVGNVIRRGAFYMRPRRFILPQTGTGGYGIRPYVFEAAKHQHRGGAPRGAFSLWSKTESVGAHSICARGGLSYRKRARADMESAPTFFVGTERGTFFPVACVGATIGRPSTYRRNAFSGTVFL